MWAGKEEPQVFAYGLDYSPWVMEMTCKDTLYAKEPPAPRKYGAINTGEEIDPQGAFSGSDRVFRGGSWDNVSDDCAVSYRNYVDPYNRSRILGFRGCVPVLNKTTCCVKEQP